MEKTNSDKFEALKKFSSENLTKEKIKKFIEEDINSEKIIANIKRNKNQYGLVCAVLMFVSVFLPWIKFNTSAVDNGWALWSKGSIMIGLKTKMGYVALIISLIAFFMYKVKHEWTVYVGLVGIFFAIYKLNNASGSYLSESVFTYVTNETTYYPTYGIYLYLIAAILFTLIARSFIGKKKNQILSDNENL